MLHSCGWCHWPLFGQAEDAPPKRKHELSSPSPTVLSWFHINVFREYILLTYRQLVFPRPNLVASCERFEQIGREVRGFVDRYTFRGPSAPISNTPSSIFGASSWIETRKRHLWMERSKSTGATSFYSLDPGKPDGIGAVGHEVRLFVGAKSVSRVNPADTRPVTRMHCLPMSGRNWNQSRLGIRSERTASQNAADREIGPSENNW